MPRRYESGILTEEELLNKIFEYKNILPKELIDYLFALLDLEISALSRKDITSAEFIALSDLEGFKDLVFYNLYKTAQSYVNRRNGKYIEEDYQNGYRISYGTVLNEDLLFSLVKKEDNKSVIKLSNAPDLSFRSLVETYDKARIEALEEKKEIKLYTLDELKQMHNLLTEISARQRALYEILLSDTSIVPCLEQAQKDDDIQTFEEGCTKLLVYTNPKEPIFK